MRYVAYQSKSLASGQRAFAGTKSREKDVAQEPVPHVAQEPVPHPPTAIKVRSPLWPMVGNVQVNKEKSRDLARTASGILENIRISTAVVWGYVSNGRQENRDRGRRSMAPRGCKKGPNSLRTDSNSSIHVIAADGPEFNEAGSNGESGVVTPRFGSRSTPSSQNWRCGGTTFSEVTEFNALASSQSMMGTASAKQGANMLHAFNNEVSAFFTTMSKIKCPNKI